MFSDADPHQCPKPSFRLTLKLPKSGLCKLQLEAQLLPVARKDSSPDYYVDINIRCRYACHMKRLKRQI